MIARRTLLAGLPALAALAVPAVAAGAKPVYVRVGSPSFAVSPETMAAINRWREADAVEKVARAEYDAWSAATPPWKRGNECPEHGEWLRTNFAMQDALSDMMRALRRTT